MSDINWKGHISMLGANVMWGLMSPIAKLVIAAGVFSPLVVTDFRIFGAAVLFWIASAFSPREHVPAKDLILLAGAGMLGVMFNQGCFIFGVGYTTPGEASIITTTMPLWVMVLAALILKEPITVKKIGGIVLGAAGALLLVLNSSSSEISGDNPMLGDILVFTAQLSYALYLTLYKNFIKKYTLFTLMKWMFTFAALAILPFSITETANTDWSQVTMQQILSVTYIVVFATFIAYTLIMVGQKNLRPTIVGMYNYVQPIVACLVGIALGFESFTVLKTIAILLIFSGVYLVTISRARIQ